MGLESLRLEAVVNESGLSQGHVHEALVTCFSENMNLHIIWCFDTISVSFLRVLLVCQGSKAIRVRGFRLASQGFLVSEVKLVPKASR